MGHFIVQKIKSVAELKVGDQIEESDFATLTPDGNFLQLKYVEDQDKPETYKIRPGIWTMQQTFNGLKLQETAFVNDHLLETYTNTKELRNCIECFFRNLHIYKEFGIEIPRRAALLYGPPGTGKTSSAISVCNQYVKDGKTAVLMWATDKFDAYHIKEFIKSFEYVGVEKLIVIAEDIGGVEIDQVRMKSTSSLLSLLDNKEKTFKVPVFIIATTNFAENFLGNLTNRPGRFDDKIFMTYPNAKARQELLKFFSRKELDPKILTMIAERRFNDFSAAHLQEVIIRSAIYEISIEQCLERIHKEIEQYKKAFSDKGTLGIKSSIEYDEDL